MSGHVAKVIPPKGRHDPVTLPTGCGKTTFALLLGLRDDPRFSEYWDEFFWRTTGNFTEFQWSLWHQLQRGAARTEVRTFELDVPLFGLYRSEDLPSQIDLVLPFGDGLVPTESKPTRTVRFVASPKGGGLPRFDALDLTRLHGLGHLLMHRAGVDDSPLKPQSLIEKSFGVRRPDPLDVAPIPDDDSTAERFRRLVARVTRALVRIVDAKCGDPWRIDQVFQRWLARIKTMILGSTRGGRRLACIKTEEAPTLGHTIDRPNIRGPNVLPQLSRATYHAQQTSPFVSTGRMLALT